MHPVSLTHMLSLPLLLFRCVSASTPFPSACFVDGELPLDGDGAAVLAETFGILSLKEIKLSALSGAAGAGGDEPQEDEQMAMAKAVMQVAQKKVVSQVC